jgi:deazaflavin-dependent oxidoreductase (nitroreductase family)
MPATPRIARLRPFTTRLFNPLARHVAGWLPWFGILTYLGRTSGRTYHTPINVFRHGDNYVFALTYGRDVQWVKNVLAADGATLRTRGRDVRLVDPVIYTDPSRRLMPLPVRIVLRFDRVDDFVRMRAA